MMNATLVKIRKMIANAKKRLKVTVLPITAGSSTYSLEVFFGAESVL